MHRRPKYRAIIAALLTGVYIFVALFSQNFHTHASGDVFHENHFTKTEKTFSSSAHFSEFSDCLACHIFHEGKVLVPQEFSLFTSFFPDFHTQIFACEKRAASIEMSFRHLRGPPVYFI